KRRVELRARTRTQELARLVAGYRSAVGPLAAQRIECVSDRDDPCCYRYIVSREPLGIAVAVPALMVISNGGHDGIWKAGLVQDRRSDGRVDLHFLHLGGRQLGGFIQNMIGQRQLAYIVEQCTGSQCVDFIIREPEDGAHSERIALCTADVADAHLVAGVDSGRKRLDSRKMHTARVRYLPGLLLEADNMNFVCKIAGNYQ